MGNKLCMSCKPCNDQLSIDCDECMAKVRANECRHILKILHGIDKQVEHLVVGVLESEEAK